MTYQEAIEYLYNSAPLFQNIGAGAYKEGLYNTKLLDKHFSHPHRHYKTIHVGGTNGKGSVSHTLAAILQHAGYKVGLYTSPHLLDFRERIRVNGEMIPQERVVRFVEEERNFYEPLHPSFFELTTALAFLYFSECKVDVAVIEVGLGGRLDCTNIIQPELSIITNISFDHTQFLGNTLPKIASEKAGIIKKSCPVVIGEVTDQAVGEVFLQKAREVNAPLVWAEEDDEIISFDHSPHERVYLTRHFGTVHGELPGLCQEKNARSILCAVKQLRLRGFSFSESDVKNGFQHVTEMTGLSGRWQIISEKPCVICDTAHNVGGIRYIVEQLASLLHENLHLVFGMVNDKDIHSVLELLPKDARYYFTQASVKRALDMDELARMAAGHGLHGEKFSNVKAAYSQALENARENDIIYIGGSTFVVSDFLK